jgi:hypothetical protein
VLTTHTHLAPRLRMSRALPLPFPPVCAFMTDYVVFIPLTIALETAEAWCFQRTYKTSRWPIRPEFEYSLPYELYLICSSLQLVEVRVSFHGKRLTYLAYVSRPILVLWCCRPSIYHYELLPPSDAYGYASISKLFQTKFDQTWRNTTSMHLLQEVTLPICSSRQDVGVSECTWKHTDNIRAATRK